ncbi:MAG: FAD-binding oxidoreductase [Pseudomonadota bacterium]
MSLKIAIVGGGVVGCSLAYHIAERGLGQVTLFERDRLASGTTWHSAGNITWKPHGDEDQQVLCAFELIDRLERDGAHSTGWHHIGRLFLGLSEAGLSAFEGFHQAARDRGVDCRWLSAKQAAARYPLLAESATAGAWFNPLSGRVNPADFTACLARAAKAQGAEVLEQALVERLDTKNGAVKGLICDGELHAFDRVVVTAGLWSRGLTAPLGYSAAQWGCEHFYLIARTEPRLDRDTPSFVCPEALLYGREEVGGMLFGLFDEDATPLDPASLPEPFAFSLLPEDWDKVAPYVEAATRLFPVLETAPISNFINGPESFTPDGNPLIGPVPGIEGLYICSGMNSHGVTLAPAAGHIIADLLAEQEPRFPTERYDPTRFGDQGANEEALAAAVSKAPSLFYRAVHS